MFHYSPTTRVYAGFREASDTELYLRDERAWTGPDPFLPEYLPDEDWFIEWLTLLFDIGPGRVREYIAQLMEVITTEQTDLPSIVISEPVNYPTLPLA